MPVVMKKLKKNMRKRDDAWFLNPASSKEIVQIAANLLKTHKLSGFEYVRIHNDGSGYQFFSNPNLIGYNQKKGVPITAPAPNEIISERFWYIPSKAGRYQQIYRDWKEEFGIETIINLIELHKGYYEMFTFISDEDMSLCASRLLNTRPEFETFSNSFRENAKLLLSQADRERISYSGDLLPNFHGYENDKDLENKQSKQVYQLVTQLLGEISRSYRTENKKLLSKRELQCVQLLVLGYTAGDIAHALSLSIRTIESYLESIRNKLQCSKKSEIISKVLRQIR